MYVSAKEWKVMSVRDSLRFVIQSTTVHFATDDVGVYSKDETTNV